MSIVLIRQALEKAVSNVSGGISSAQTRWENTDFTPTAGTPYQRVDILPAEPANPSMGDGFRREQGLLQISLCFPQMAGAKAAADAAEILRVAFKRGNTFTQGSVSVIISRTPEISAGYTEQDRWVVVVRVRYYANI